MWTAVFPESCTEFNDQLCNHIYLKGETPEGAWSLSLSVEKFTQRWVGAAGLQYYTEGTHQQGCACCPGEGAEPWELFLTPPPENIFSCHFPRCI